SRLCKVRSSGRLVSAAATAATTTAAVATATAASATASAATTVATPAAAVAPAASAASATAVFFGLGFVNGNRPAALVGAVEGGDGRLGLGVAAHFDESESLAS